MVFKFCAFFIFTAITAISMGYYVAVVCNSFIIV